MLKAMASRKLRAHRIKLQEIADACHLACCCHSYLGLTVPEQLEEWWKHIGPATIIQTVDIAAHDSGPFPTFCHSSRNLA